MDRKNAGNTAIFYVTQRKTAVTGIKYEPWHIRYVGLPHSVIMKEKNFVLEEYLELSKRRKVYYNAIHVKNI